MLSAVWHIWLELAPWLLLGAAVAGLMHALLPPGFLRRRLTGRGGVLNAVLLGVPLPLCSCGVIPTGLGLKRQGASDGATVGFLISTPQTGVDSILVTSAFLGLPFALFKVVWAALTGVIGGWLADAAAKPMLPVLGEEVTEQKIEHRWRAAFDHAIELLRSIWRWILAGVLISAAIQTLLPADGLTALAGYGGLLGMLVALVISLPLYVCATASVPIAASLVAAGLPAGAALVFLMAGPATNVATIGAVYRTLGARQLAVYLGTLILGSIIGGLLFGWLIDTQNAIAMTHVHAAPWWAIACGVLLAGIMAWFAVDNIRRLLFRPANNANLPHVEVGVEGMTCAGCVATLEKTLNADPSVQSSHVTLHPGKAVAYGAVTLEHLKQLVSDAGYRAI